MPSRVNRGDGRRLCDASGTFKSLLIIKMSIKNIKTEYHAVAHRKNYALFCLKCLTNSTFYDIIVSRYYDIKMEVDL